MEILDTPTVLRDISCYQFALYGGLNRKKLKNICERFDGMGNYLLDSNTFDFPNLDNVNREELDTISRFDRIQQKENIMRLLCKEFNLVIGTKGAVCFLYGLFRENQMLPEHMWLTYGKYIYDTMPESPIRAQLNQKGLNPPSEAEILPRNLVSKIGLQSPTKNQLVIIDSTAWQIAQ